MTFEELYREIRVTMLLSKAREHLENAKNALLNKNYEEFQKHKAIAERYEKRAREIDGRKSKSSEQSNPVEQPEETSQQG